MIHQQNIYKTLQNAFQAEHPGFTFPKHELEDQSEKFRRAILHASVGINVLHENELAPQKELVQKYRSLSETRFSQYLRDQDIIKDLKVTLFFSWCIFLIVTGVLSLIAFF